ncbi:hypothetical protein [Desulfitibacter alkalitolerans]|uniref:hypothetical protein n=1 Tax=Desulfitibacter alkalitolerans TaxID=264641 RepID=UPI00047F3F9E|nr:hypothetical protein [Desulfitibacter alkalitolerans]
MGDIYDEKKALRNWIRRFSFMLLGASAFANPVDKLNPYNLIIGMIIGLLFSWLFKRFMYGFLGMVNRAKDKYQARRLVRYAADVGMLFLVPFALMLATAVFIMNWTVTSGLISAGMMAVGIAASIELGKLKGKQEIRNTLTTSFVAFLFSMIWIVGFQYVSRVPVWVEGAVIFIGSLMSGGGFPL